MLLERSVERAALLCVHAEILTAKFWRDLRQRPRESEVVEVLPFHAHRVRIASNA